MGTFILAQPCPHVESIQQPASVTGRVYIASSLSTYTTPRYDRMIKSTRSLFPHADILPARDLFKGNAEWLAKWPDIVSNLDALVFFDDNDGHIGYGVWTEISDAIEHGIPVYAIGPGDRLYDFETEIEVTLRPWDWRQFAVVGYVTRCTTADDLAAVISRVESKKAATP